MGVVSSPEIIDVTALAINVRIPEPLQWTDTRRGETFRLTTLNVRLLPDGHLAARAYGRPTGGGRVTDRAPGDRQRTYEIEVILDDGRHVDVQLDESFTVVGTVAVVENVG